MCVLERSDTDIGYFPNLLSTLFLDLGSLIGPGVLQLSVLAGQGAPGICPSLSPGYRCALSNLTFMDAEDPKPALHACTAHMLLIHLLLEAGSNVAQAAFMYPM